MLLIKLQASSSHQRLSLPLPPKPSMVSKPWPKRLPTNIGLTYKRKFTLIVILFCTQSVCWNVRVLIQIQIMRLMQIYRLLWSMGQHLLNIHEECIINWHTPHMLQYIVNLSVVFWLSLESSETCRHASDIWTNKTS